MEKLHELEKLLEKLKTNEEKEGIEVLKGKYKKGYIKLRKQIADTASSAFAHLATTNLYIRESDQVALGMIKETFQAILKEEKKEGLGKKLGNIVLDLKDLDLFAKEAMRVRAKLVNSKTYRMYWLSHCRISDKGCYNDLINAWWYDGLWSADGITFFSAPPADLDGFNAVYAEEMEAYGKCCGKAA